MNNSIIENITHIAVNTGYMIVKEQINVDNSSEFVTNIINLGNKFEQYNNKKEDYINNIDEFSEEKLLELYKSKE